MNYQDNPADRNLAGADFLLGPHLVQVSRNTIHGPETETRVEPMAMNVLVCLARAEGRTVSREALNRQVWEGRVVGDKVLTRAISNLRKALGDDPRKPALIETISKSGYRLLVPAIPSETSPNPLTPANNAETKPIRTGFALTSAKTMLMAGASLAVAGFIAVWVLMDTKTLEIVQLPFPTGPETPVTSYPGHELRPRLAPNGDRVVFAWRGNADDNWDLYVQHLNNGEPFRLTNHPDADLSPAWAPDGSRVAFFRFSEKTCGIYIQPVPGGKAQKVRDYYRIPIEEIAFAAPKLEWAPDGNGLAFSEIPDVKGPLRIVLFSLENGSTTTLTHPDDGIVGDLDPAFSPDGRFLAVTRVKSWANQDLVVLDRQNGEESQITSDGRMILGHDWRTDGERLVFSSNRASNFGLWEVARTGGPVQWIPTSGQQLKYPNLGGINDAMVFENWHYDTNIWRFPLSENEAVPPRMDIGSTRWDFQPDYNHHGQKVAFISNRSGSFEVWQDEKDGGQPQKLTNLRGALPGGPRWSPQGDALAFHVYRNGSADLFLWREGMGPAKPLMETDADELLPEWSADGRSLFFTSNREGSWQLYSIQVTGEDTVALTNDGGFFCRSAQNGSFLVFTRGGDRDVWRLPLPNGIPQRLFALDSQGDWGNLAVTDRGVFFIERDASFSAILAFYDFETGSVKRIRPLSNKIPFHEPGMAAAPDGAWILISQIDRTENDVYLSYLKGDISHLKQEH